MLAEAARLLKPNVCSVGYGLFLAVNATGIWGGVFPFLPMSIQTHDVMFWFYLAQSLALAAVFFAVGCLSARGLSQRLRSSQRVICSSALYFTGWAFLIAAMYAKGLVLPFAVAGGACLGGGAGLFYLMWQRMFSSGTPTTGLHDLLAGFAYAAVFYAALYLVPRAVTAYLIPLVFLPLFALALIMGNRRVDYTQPMYRSKARENRRVYRHAWSGCWRSAFSLGAVAFCTGVVRALAIEQPELGSLVNLLSMAALFAGVVVVLGMWQLKGLRMNIMKLYRFIFPVLLSALLVLAFVPALAYARWLAAALFALYSMGLVLAMMQCAQVSHKDGVNPSFLFGLFGGVVYGLHDLGFIAGSLSGAASFLEMDPISVMATLSIYLLAIIFFVGAVDFSGGASQVLYGASIELIAPQDENGNVRGRRKEAKGGAFKDRTAIKISALREEYGLSEREAQVADLIVRGNTVPRIAEQLYISENTVRTHSKRIYSKLGIHKKQELIALTETF